MTNDDRLSRLVIEGYLAQLHGWEGDNHWTWSVVDELVHHRPDLAWPILLELIRRVPDDELGLLAAGPLEDFIADHGPRIIDALEAEAATNPRLCRALSGVWQNATPPSVWTRVEVLMDRSVDLDAGPPEWFRSQIDVAIEGAPPTRAGDDSEGEVEARARLLEATSAAKLDGPEPWDVAVFLELKLEPADPWPAGTPEVLLAVVEALAADRPAGLVPPSLADTAILTTARLVREARVTELRSRTPGYRLTLARMSPGQRAAFDSSSTLDEMLDRPDVGAVSDELADEPPTPG